jgi:hypothetical protein
MEFIPKRCKNVSSYRNQSVIKNKQTNMIFSTDMGKGI